MSAVENGFVYYFIVFGILEVISNLYHLTRRTKEKISESAKKQHGEIPADLEATHYVVKAIFMLAFGAMFLLCGLILLINNNASSSLFYIPLLSFSIYSVIQAVFYRKFWRVWTALIVYNLPLVIFVLLH